VGRMYINKLRESALLWQDRKYLKTLKIIIQRNKRGFNWPVLLFGPLWYLFNGMIAKGLFWLLVAIIVGSLITN
jgi:hypothetical protein